MNPLPEGVYFIFAPYCNNCPDLNVTLESDVISNLGGEKFVSHRIRCKNEDICKNLYKAIKERAKRKEE